MSSFSVTDSTFSFGAKKKNIMPVWQEPEHPDPIS